ncbi:hypothetical protein C7Y47_01940 [Lysinibacillus sphaericus]|uniref:Uncharacterized protein n=1 Tax=Lysinibacillus sphaericus TaxID=1421 RepID=A0A544V136_LYSSH|nr:hypothetical protein [Lysinibacillus sp. SDF0037]TQR39812.1 hypothetical protein C7Y47_01940 [Lysinibacillus sp. SDF0037]
MQSALCKIVLARYYISVKLGKYNRTFILDYSSAIYTKFKGKMELGVVFEAVSKHHIIQQVDGFETRLVQKKIVYTTIAENLIRLNKKLPGDIINEIKDGLFDNSDFELTEEESPNRNELLNFLKILIVKRKGNNVLIIGKDYYKNSMCHSRC